MPLVFSSWARTAFKYHASGTIMVFRIENEMESFIIMRVTMIQYIEIEKALVNTKCDKVTSTDLSFSLLTLFITISGCLCEILFSVVGC